MSNATKETTRNDQDGNKVKQTVADDCQYRVNRTAIFRKPTFKSWFDPENWKSALKDGTTQSYKLSKEPTPIPHLQQIPCRYDKASFPPNAAYKVVIMVIVIKYVRQLYEIYIPV